MKTTPEFPYSFHVFGSSSSLDLDVVVFVENISDNPFPEIQRCKTLGMEIKKLSGTTKEVNCNLAILKEGVVVHVLKGSSDELNNAILDTYKLHTQYHPLQIQHRLERDVELKLLRTVRVLLSLLSRSEYRNLVKSSLAKEVDQQIQALGQCNLLDIHAKNRMGNENDVADFKKIYAFQIAQTIGLLDGIELYTKEAIISHFPELAPFLQRDKDTDMAKLEQWKLTLLERMKAWEFKNKKEFKR